MENLNAGKFPELRLRRLRQTEALRRLVRETRLSLDQFVMPYFVKEGRGVRDQIDSMPGQFRYSPDTLLTEIEGLELAGINAILLFGISESKDEKASQAYSSTGIVQKTVREIKKNFEDLLVITDVCLCAYTRHGHCGVVNKTGEIENDPSLILLADAALSHAEAGADIVAPSDMMDGRIGSIRRRLDQRGFSNLPIMSYAAKYASAFYGPFRDAAHSSPEFGDRKSYQMDPANIKEALRAIQRDIEEGADIVMVKPALSYLDVICEAKRNFTVPIAGYSVSGEYAMIKAAVERGWLDEKKVVLEILLSQARAGCDIFLTYYAKQLASWIHQDKSLNAYILNRL